MLLRICSIILILFAFWLMLSGQFSTLLVTLGVFSALLSVAVSMRMRLFHGRTHLAELVWTLPKYWLWLSFQIAKSGLDVALRIVHPKLPIEPGFIKIPVSKSSGLGRATYANSITLTPGTLTIEIDEENILVHTLTKAAGTDLISGKMHRKIPLE